jgi:hypothetical protein
LSFQRYAATIIPAHHQGLAELQRRREGQSRGRQSGNFQKGTKGSGASGGFFGMAWDRSKLDALQKKYGESHGGELFNPKFRRVADKIFTETGTRLAPYSGVPTFLTAPYHQVDNDNPDFGDLQVAMLGVPMDLGVTNRPGSRFGPRALRTIERIGPYNHVLD